MSIRDKATMLRALWYTPGGRGRWGIPIVFEGQPGTGKTSMVEQVAEACGFEAVATLIASLHEPADFLGLPVPVDGVSRFAAPAWAASMTEQPNGLVFFDEVNTAPPAVQAALLRVILDGVVGEVELPPGVRFVAAQNSAEDAAGGWNLAAPLANRFLHVSWGAPDIDEWSDWLLAGGDEQADALDPEAEQKRVMRLWPQPWAKARGLVSGFLRARRQLIIQMPRAGDPAASKAWPSPRTWVMACRVLASIEVHGVPEHIADEMVAGAVGPGAATEFMAWCAKADLPDPADVLDGRIKFKHDGKRLDRTAAVLSSCAALVTPLGSDKRKERATALWSLMLDIFPAGADLIVPAARALIKSKLGKVGPSAKAVLVKIQPVLAAAGVTAQ